MNKNNQYRNQMSTGKLPISSEKWFNPFQAFIKCGRNLNILSTMKYMCVFHVLISNAIGVPGFLFRIT